MIHSPIDDPDNNTDSQADDYISKSQLKREMQALQDIGKQLVELPESQLQKFELPEKLINAIQEARRLKKNEAKRRQMQFIGKLMRTVDTETIQQTLDRLDQSSKAYRQHFHQLESWRDRIVNEGAPAIEALITLYPNADRQQLRNLQRQAAREQEHKRTPAASRKLFSYLRELLD